MEARQKLERDIVMKKHQIYKKKKDEADLYKNEKNKHVDCRTCCSSDAILDALKL